MSDLISREDIPYIDLNSDMPQSKVRVWVAFKEQIDALPSAEPKTGWIPCSERLPDIGDTYLVTVMVGKEIRTDVADSFGSYIDGFWDTFNDWIEDEECHVIAWMPLPPGYQGE